MNTLYENQYIGAFIYSLGIYAGLKKGNHALNAISLMQQTPLDTTYSDLFVAWEGRSFIFEFKRAEEYAKKEHDKPIKNKVIEAINSNKYIKKLADKAHFMCYPITTLIDNGLYFQRYSSVLNDKSQSSANRSKLDSMVIDFMDNINCGMNIEEMKTYCDFILRESGKSTEDMSGIIINIDKTGKINFVEYDNFSQLEIKYERAKELKNDNVKNRSSGLDIGM